MQRVRFRIDLAPQCSIGPGKIDLLEAIANTGSIRQAARTLRMSYRYAWLLVDSLNKSFSEPATMSSVGGSGGGGVELTAFGAELVRCYRALARRIDALAESEFASVASRLAEHPAKAAPVRRRRLSKSARGVRG